MSNEIIEYPDDRSDTTVPLPAALVIQVQLDQTKRDIVSVYDEITDISTDLFAVRRELADTRRELAYANNLISELARGPPSARPALPSSPPSPRSESSSKSSSIVEHFPRPSELLNSINQIHGEVAVLRNDVTGCQGQILHLNNIVPSPAQLVALTRTHPLTPTSSSHPSPPLLVEPPRHRPPPLPIGPPRHHPSLNPVSYSSTVETLELNTALHQEYFSQRIAAVDSNIGIVADYNHWIDITNNLPPDHHDHHHP